LRLLNRFLRFDRKLIYVHFDLGLVVNV
jgi:hypothetical protein